ncbi:MAG TPA: ribosome biogenesis GTPase Der [Dictyoglomaceae bacterium]|nr:ribosome biogenesis GTPase Der [Dictyoglomaceae bacterium]HOL40006.1 ribosome biogenesis GTPase Der [Dictyoglomaceae bacterium]HOP95433.1 ribosome biogenesis GTPase Der [Dictyoglomaceae bacterium]HPP15589.1 ribosome biogenesis GTPase Der [Dictyoglomaceae bacterium]HPU42904.1 ribosome biogenesis GTPase Der [Dictyoglomaceae bacterium]
MVSLRDTFGLEKDIPIISIVGKPNVGKSILFNRIAGEEKAIVSGKPGVTRDPLIHLCEYEGKYFYLIDSAGWGLDDNLSHLIIEKIEEVIEISDLILFVVDGRNELTALDFDFADLLRNSGKDIILVVNKMEGRIDSEVYLSPYTVLGLGDPFPISALHKQNITELLDKVVSLIPEIKKKEEKEDIVKFAFVGRPNSGKSSLINTLIGKNRNIVSEVAGTTRDVVDLLWEFEGKKFMILDTPGLRRPARVERGLEELSVRRALRTITRVDVAIMVIDLSVGLREQEKRILRYIEEKGKSCLIVFNKTDLIPSLKQRREFEKGLKYLLAPFDYFPYIFTSAITGYNVKKIISWVERLYQVRNMRIPTAQVNRAIQESLEKVNFSKKGKTLKIYYATQVDIAPPKFIFFVNEPEAMSKNAQKYFEKYLRNYFSFTGTPIKIEVRKRSSEK